MRVIIDRLGRLVILKSVRVALGVVPGTELELMADRTGLKLEPLRAAERSIDEADGLPTLGYVSGAQLSDEDVRSVRGQLSR
jgi:bifunctional DNA-binding transcriptional regulator/antitoxin component of YhaV-PrlF toxin-antitoxin module